MQMEMAMTFKFFVLLVQNVDCCLPYLRFDRTAQMGDMKIELIRNEKNIVLFKNVPIQS